MKRVFTLLSLLTLATLTAPALLAQSNPLDPFAAEDTPDPREQLLIELRYLEERLYEISADSSLVVGSDYESLLLEVSELFVTYPEAPEVWGLSGMVKYYYQLEMDEESALSIAEGAKNDLETAIAMDAGVLDGDPYLYLGNLYLNTPGWPSGFGDEDRAGEMLWRAVALNPEDLDTNYFLARYLIRIGDLEEARAHLEIALRAPVSLRREAGADARREEITRLLDEL